MEKQDRRRGPRSAEVRAKISATMRERGIRPDGKETVFFKPRPLKEEVLRPATVAEIMWLGEAT